MSIHDFCVHAQEPSFAKQLALNFELQHQEKPSSQEQASWANSLPELAKLLQSVSAQGHILIEYVMPIGARRADCLLIGTDQNGDTHVVVVELKQWSQGTIRLNDAYDMGWLSVQASTSYSTDHPCEQAAVYRATLDHMVDFGQSTVRLHSLAYLHNYVEEPEDLLRSKQFEGCLHDAVLLTLTKGQQDAEKLLSRLKGSSPLLAQLAHPKLRYSDTFIANFSNKLNCSALFRPSEEQIQAFRSILAALSDTRQPTCCIVKGIVGTGKTVLAMMLIRHFMQRGRNPKYHVVSAAIKDCLRGLDFYSGGAASTEHLIVDEAHRLRIEELPKLQRDKRLVVYFIDDNQWLQPSEDCRSADIEASASAMGMHVIYHSLTTQLRCKGAGHFFHWVDRFFNERQLLPLELDEGFEVKVAETPQQLEELLRLRAKDNITCRMVAGYCWDWRTRNLQPGEGYDIEIEGWRARWNQFKAYAEWNRAPGFHTEVGAIYTVQGFEHDYVGVLIGTDLAFTEKGLRIQPQHQKYDQLVKSLERKDVPEEQRNLEFARAVRNIYYVLLTRAKRGVFIYAAHPGLRAQLSELLPVADRAEA